MNIDRRKAILGITAFGLCSAATATNRTFRKSPEKRTKDKKAKDDFEKAGNLQAKIDVIAEYLGLKDVS